MSTVHVWSCGQCGAPRRASRLFDDLRVARADGTYGRLLGKLARMDVLLLDDWAWRPRRTRSAATCSRSSRTAMGAAPAS